MNGIIFDIKRMSINDGPGIRTTVFLKGCNLECKWCHNPEGIGFKQELIYDCKKCLSCKSCANICLHGVHIFKNDKHLIDIKKCILCGNCVDSCPSKALNICGRYFGVNQIMDIIMRDKLFYDQSRGGTTISGGEPLCQYDFIENLLFALKSKNLNIILDTNADVNWEKINNLLSFIDSFRIDLKIMDTIIHKKYTGSGNEKILENLNKLSELNKKVVVVLPLIPNVNDSDININLMIKFLSSLPNKFPLNILPYHDYYISKLNQLGRKYSKFNTPTKYQIEKIKKNFEENGIKVIKPSTFF